MKRYRIRSHEGYGHLEVDEQPDGDWIKVSDLPKIEEQVRREERGRRRDLVEKARDLLTALESSKKAPDPSTREEAG